MTIELECPCEEASRENCTKCQDLVIWYFDKPDTSFNVRKCSESET